MRHFYDDGLLKKRAKVRRFITAEQQMIVLKVPSFSRPCFLLQIPLIHTSCFSPLRPTVDEVNQWAQSLDTLLSNKCNYHWADNYTKITWNGGRMTFIKQAL